MRTRMTNFKVVYRGEDGRPRATVCSYSEDGANDLADEMEDKGVHIIDVIGTNPGTPPEEIEAMYK